MRPYEIVVIFDATLEETVIRETSDRVVDFIRERGGQPGQVERWGRRTFAYQIKHRTEGYYVVIEAVAEPEVIAEVDRLLTLSDDVLRHRVIRQPERAAGRKTAIPAPQAEPAAQAG